MKVFIVKQLDNSFKPAYDSDIEQLRKVKAGDIVECEIKRKRNIKFHKKFFALLDLVFKNQEKYNNIDHLRKDLTIASGFYEQHITFTGQVRTEPISISFSNMKQHEFDKFYTSILDTIIKYFKFDKESIEEYIEQYF